MFLATSIYANSVKNYDRQIREQKQELARIKKDLDFQRQQIKDIKVQESGVLNTISLMERNLAKTQDYISNLDKNASTLSVSIAQYNSQIDSLTVKLRQQKKMMEYRVKRLYMNGNPLWGKIKEIFDAKSNVGRHIYYIKRIINADKDLMKSIQKTQNDIEDKKKKLNLKIRFLVQVKVDKIHEQEELANQTETQRIYLDNLKTNREMQIKALEEYESNQKMLSKLIKNLEKKRIAAQKKAEAERIKKNQEKTKAKVIAAKNKCWPMNGEIISKYGRQLHPVLKTVTKNLGIEIRGRKTSSIKVAAPGEVVMITDIQGRGRGIIVDHGASFYSVYGHLRNIKVKEGDKLSRCQEIANPSDEDSMDGVKLFFQVSEGVKTVDPLKWLEKAR